MVRYLMLCAAASFLSVAYADDAMQLEDPAQQEDRPLYHEPYGGVVANQTMTVAGQDFYRHFVMAWRDKEASERYAISIHEQPTARFGSRVWVEFAQRRIFQAFLPPARAAIRPISERAAEIAYDVILETEVQQALFRATDLGPDELR